MPVTSDGLVATAIKNDPNAIGYVGLAHSKPGSGVKPLKLNGVACDTAHIKNETYPLFRYIWAVLPTKNPNADVEKFFDWVRTSKAGRARSSPPPARCPRSTRASGSPRGPSGG